MEPDSSQGQYLDDRGIVVDGYRLTIPLTQGKSALVNAIDYGYLSQWKWFAMKCRRGYIAGRQESMGDGKQKTIYLHRVVADRMGLDMSKIIDHIDHDTLDSTRPNLRAANPRESTSNRMKFRNRVTSLPKGVYVHGDGFQAEITSGGARHCLGTYPTPAEASMAYNEAAERLHGEFACLNEEDVDD